VDYSKLQKATIKSNNVGFGPMPEPLEEVEQRLTISRCGRVWFSAYSYGGTRLRKKQVWLGKERACRLLHVIGTYFCSCEELSLATDIGMWEMRLQDIDGAATKFVGSLCCAFQVEGRDLSTIIREELGMRDLFLYDGNNE
jgi:hypothetical protein